MARQMGNSGRGPDDLDRAQGRAHSDSHSDSDMESAEDSGYGSLSALYGWAQGARPYSRLRAAAMNPFGDLRARVGVNPGAGLNDPSANAPPPRLPDEQQLHVQLRGRGKRLLGVEVDLYLDLMNVLVTRQTTVATDSASFQPAVRGNERWFRLGAEYRY